MHSVKCTLTILLLYHIPAIMLYILYNYIYTYILHQLCIMQVYRLPPSNLYYQVITVTHSLKHHCSCMHLANIYHLISVNTIHVKNFHGMKLSLHGKHTGVLQLYFCRSHKIVFKCDSSVSVFSLVHLHNFPI